MSREKTFIPTGALILFAILHFGAVPARAASAPTSKVDSLDELYEKTKKEGGKLNLYASLSANSIEVILPAFNKRVPFGNINQLNGSLESLKD
jgi:hypothetical protein